MSSPALLLLVLLSCVAPETRPGGQSLRPAPAQEPAGEAAAAEQKPGEKEPQEQQAVTGHSARIGGRKLDYTATAGTLLLKEEQGKAKASVFFIAYALDGVKDPAARPVTFCFNGGPGSSSVWLHLGAFGPRRVEMDENGFPLPPPFRLVENEQSILDLTDLVFIDPVTTGYSRAVPGEDDKQFHGVDEDVESVAEFIRLWLTRSQRWASPKFLAGESYGTTRAAGLAGRLQNRHGIYLNGIVLVSSILNFGTARFDRGNDLPYILFLPTYAATAWYHGRLQGGQGLEELLAEVRQWAANDYALALMQGDKLAASERQQIAATLARFTGLSAEYCLDTNLRIHISRFCKELMRAEDRTVGRLDSRFTGADYDSAGERSEFDPSMAGIRGPYTATLNDYVRRELEFESDLPYEILSGRVHPWSYSKVENQYLNVAETLRGAMTRNRALKVFVANGYYDLATPFFATEYTFDHLGLPAELQENVSMGWYESGHMMYIHMPSLQQLKADLAAFYAAAAR